MFPGSACSALAQSFQELGDVSVATQYLEAYLQVARSADQRVGQTEASMALGRISTALNDHEAALKHFESAYETALEIGDR